ncbi:Cholesterol desaturase daf-36 [Mizuhopecten yessoensis]|uniref:cholesterol 7-desaturase n=2 Tax=Mizuhopecten yessoensis TaxID=6573 RepID=A0A210PTX3_MIZYE|nr:Cholesterol desaturase daf-36 [Mizuhopecten yessoensis]
MNSKSVLSGVLLSVLVIAVSASVSEKLLRVPLFEVGELWYRSVCTLTGRMLFLLTTWPDFYAVTTYIIVAILSVGFYYFYLIMFCPLNRIRILGDLGYRAEGKFTMKEIANSVRKRRMVGKVPAVYPNGWFGIMESHTLPRGNSTYVSILGLHLAVFRGEDGESHVLDAYCPHMGANLGIGGRVVGNCIECPFHGWQFRGTDGKATKIPYAEKVPDFTKVKAYVSKETNGWIYLWHHAEKEHKDVPEWEIPNLDNINNGRWTYRGRTEHHINAHIEEIPENGADVSHLPQVHGPMISAGVDLKEMWNTFWSFGHHKWTAAWEQNPAPEKHIGTLKLTHSLNLFGKHLPLIDMDVRAQQIGPAIVYLEFDSPIGSGVFVQSLTPVEPMVQKLVHNIYMDRKVPTIIAKFFMLGEALQVERDVMIWNNKTFVSKPMFVKSKEDSLIAKHRRWYAQFYTENSPKLTFQKESMEW